MHIGMHKTGQDKKINQRLSVYRPEFILTQSIYQDVDKKKALNILDY